MSLQRPNVPDLISPDEYIANQAKIEQARKMLEEMEQKNRVGLQRFTEVEREQQRMQEEILRQKQELERKVQEGLEAQRLIQQLEKQQSLALIPGSGVNGPNHGNGRIEEVSNRQQGHYRQYPSQNAQSSRTAVPNFPSYPPNQSQPPQQPLPQYAVDVYPTQRQGYENTGPAPAIPTMQYPQYPSSYQVPNVRQGQLNQSQYASTSQQVHNNAPSTIHLDNQSVHRQSTSTVTGQPVPKSSQGTPIASYDSFWRVQQMQQQTSHAYQPYNVQTVQSNPVTVPSLNSGLRNQTMAKAADVMPPNLPAQPTASTSSRTSVSAGPNTSQNASEMERNRETHIQPQSLYIDDLGVPYLNITEQEIASLRERMDNWIRQASPGSRHHFHEMIVLYKENQSPNPKTWIYVPWEPGSTKYARTTEIDKFFEALAKNARLVASGVISVPKKPSTAPSTHSSSTQQPVVTKPVGHSSLNPIDVPTAHPAIQTTFNRQNLALPPNHQTQKNAVSSSSATTSTNRTSTASSSIQASVRSPVTNLTSTPPSSTHVPIGLPVTSSSLNPPSSVQPPTSPPVAIPSGLTRNLPTPSQVDKKHLTKHILFALGKRSRTSFETSSPEQTAKKQVTEASSTKHVGLGESTMASSHVADISSSAVLEKVNVQPLASSTSASVTISTDTLPQADRVKLSSLPLVAPPTVTSLAPQQPQQQSLPSIAAARPDLIQPTPVPATIVQTDVRMHSPPAAANSGSRLSVPPIETLQFDAGGISQLTDSTTTSSAESTAMAVPFESRPTPAAKSSNTVAAATASTSTQQISNRKYLETRTPATTLSSGQSQFRAAPPAGSTFLTPNPYSWLLSSSSTPQLQTSIGSFSHNQLAQSSFGKFTFTSNNWATKNQAAQVASTSQDPLFLPSPSPERAPSSLPVEKTERKATKKRDRGKEVMAYVLVPKAHYSIQHHRRLEEKGEASEIEVTRNRLKRLRTKSTSVPSSVIGEEVSNNVFITENWRDSPANAPEGEAVRLAYSRLQRLPCRWDGCNVRLNSVNKLVEHLRQHKPQPRPHHQHFTCRWTQCGRRCSVKDAHLENHALQPLRCAYQDCSESYRTPSQLVKHFNARHANGTLKPSAELSKPDLTEPPLIPGSIPAYLFVTELAKPATISPERHQVLGRLVVQNIVNSDQEKPTRRTKKTAKPSSNHTLAMGHNYEFIKTRTTRYSSYLSQAVDLPLEDLDSETITRMVDEGLMLWAPEGSETGVVVDDADAEARTPMMSPSQLPSGDIKVETDGAVVRATDATNLDRHHHEHSTDEDDVEVMLTEVTA